MGRKEKQSGLAQPKLTLIQIDWSVHVKKKRFSIFREALVSYANFVTIFTAWLPTKSIINTFMLILKALLYKNQQSIISSNNKTGQNDQHLILSFNSPKDTNC